MIKRLTVSFTLILALSFISNLQAQCTYDPDSGLWVDVDGNRCANAIFTAVPFLRITPDARASAMGDIGTVTSPDANSGRYNGATTAFGDRGFTAAINYSAWLRGIVEDVQIFSVAGAYKWDDLQAISFDLLYFGLGEITYTNINGDITGTGNPSELAFSANYARKLSEKFALSAGAKYIYSNLATGQNVGLQEISSGKAFAADIGLRYQTPIQRNQNIIAALSITNLGSKIRYIEDDSKPSDFLPANIALGLGYTYDINDYNKIGLYGELNKLLVPTPPIDPETPRNDDGFPLYRYDGPIEAAFNSFGDSDNGFKGEISEISWSLGAEYMYNNVFALRAGYFHESKYKGNRQYLTAGLGISYSFFRFNYSYLIPTSVIRSPLDNTHKFSFILDFTTGNDNITPEN